MGALRPSPPTSFRGESSAIPAPVRARMEGVSWKGDDARCPRWDALAYLQFDHVSFDGTSRGEMVVATALASHALRLFSRLWSLGLPIRQARLVDDFAANDDASMAADNSSGFNFRVIAGTQILSNHALGRAIDINPLENPWRRGDRVDPPAGVAYLDRGDLRPGMFVRPGPVVAAFDELGWEWGGDWLHAFDGHHIAWTRPL